MWWFLATISRSISDFRVVMLVEGSRFLENETTRLCLFETREIMRTSRSSLIELELSCVICKEFNVPFITMCPNRPKPVATSHAIYESNSNNHYCCLPCFTLLLSNDNTSTRSKVCSICQVPHGATIHFDSTNQTCSVLCQQSLLPPKSLIHIVFGNQKSRCPCCTVFVGTFVELCRHYFEECDGFQFFCPHCSITSVTRQSYKNHFPKNCCHVKCNKPGCQFKLYPIENKSIEAKQRRANHEERHQLCETLDVMANQISYCTSLLDENKHATFVTHSRDLFNEISTDICIYRNHLQTRSEPDDVLDVSDFCLKHRKLLRFICNVLQVF